MQTTGAIVKTAVLDFFADEAVTHAAAVAFFTVLSLSPLLIILLSAVGMIAPPAQQELVQRIEAAAGPQAGQAIQTILRNVDTNRDLASISSVVGLFVLLFAATAVFVHLQGALNKIWEIEAKPGLNLGTLVRQRAASFLMVLLLGLLMLGVVLASWFLRVLLPPDMAWLGLAEGALGLGFFIVLFALLFKYLPDARIAWSDVWVGATVTALLFGAGRWALALYLRHSAIASAFGAAGSLVVLILLVYYSALILFFGAELTQAYARRYGHSIEPAEYAQRIAAPLRQGG